MATEIATAYVSLVPSFRGGGRAISRSLAGPIGQAGPQAGRSLGRSILRGVTRGVAIGGGIAAALGLRNLGREVAQAASGIQNTTATLTGLLGSAQDATDTMRRLREVARESPIDYQTYLAAGESLAYLGVSGEQAEGILSNVGAAITAAGGSSDQMESVSQALLTMVNTGRVYANDLNRISDAGVPVFSGLAEHFGTNIENVRAMVEAGEVGIEDVLATIENAEGDTFQSMLAASDAASQTFSNQWKIAKDNITTSLAEGIMPLLERLTPVMQAFAERAPALVASAVAGITTGFATIGATVDDFRDRISDFMASASGQDLKTDTLDRLSSIWGNLKLAWEGAWPAIQQIAGSLAQATAAVGISTWSILLATIDLLSDVLVDVLVPALQWLADLMTQHPGIVTAIVAAYTAWRLAQIALNVAMRANPIGLIITAIGALVTAIVYAWQNSETFRDVVTGVWTTVRDAVVAAWEWIKKWAIDPLVAGFQWAWESAVYLKDIAVESWQIMRDQLVAAWEWIDSYVINPIVSAFQWVWEKAVQLKDIAVLSWQIMRDQLGAAWQWINEHVIWPIGRAFNWVWERAVAVKDGVVGAWHSLRDGVHGAYTWMRDNVLRPVIEWFQSAWDKAVEVKDGIVSAWSTVASSIGEAFDGIWDGIKGALNTVFGFINKWMIGPLNTVLSPFDLSIPELPKLHSGGMVPGTGEKPYMLLGGESVLNPRATRALGPEVIDALNKGEGFGGWPDWLSWDRIKQAMAAGTHTEAGTGVTSGIAGAGVGLLAAIEKAVEKALDFLSPMKDNTPTFAWGPAIGTAENLGEEVIDWASVGHSAVTKRLGSIPKGGVPDFDGNTAFPLPRGSYRVGVGINGYPGHTGQDFPAPVGTPVFAPFSGTFAAMNLGNRSFGRYASVMAGTLQFIGAHLSSFIGASRQVEAGEAIGRVGSTGNSTGPHLHAEFRRAGVVQNPRSYMQFDDGGFIPPGVSGVVNQTSSPEPVLTQSQWDAVSELAGRGAALDAGAIREAMAGMEVVLVADDREIARSTNRGQAVIARRR